MSLREEGKIESVFSGTEDHGILTVQLMIEFPGAGQGFGGLALDERTKGDFIACLCAAFGVSGLEHLKGQECFALRCFEDWGSPIEGLESKKTGRRFVLTEWRRRHWGPDVIKDPLEQAIASIKGQIASHRRRLIECHEELERVRGRYHPIGASS